MDCGVLDSDFTIRTCLVDEEEKMNLTHAEYKAQVGKDARLFGEDYDYFAESKVQKIQRFYDDIMLYVPNPINVLEIGCGTGGILDHLEHLSYTTTYLGVDISEHAIAQARIRAGVGMTFKVVRSTDIPVEDATMDLVIMSMVIHHVQPEYRMRILFEVYRVLKRGGVLAVFEHNPINPVTRWVVKHSPLDEGVSLIDRKQMSFLIHGAGLHIARQEYMTFFPKFLSSLRFLEPRLTECPLGAQYFIGAMK